MMITINNYEEYIIDYLDGMLSKKDQIEFEQFLDQHPHIKKEMEGINDMVIEPEDISFLDKSSLLKTDADDLNIPFEDYIAIKEIETGLDKNEEEWKKEYIAESNENEKAFVTYQKTKLQSDNAVRFPNKASLKRATIIPLFSITTLRKVSAAAVIAILLSIGTFPYLKESGDQIKSVAVVDPPSLIVLPKKTNAQSKEKKPVKKEQNKSSVSTEVSTSENKTEQKESVEIIKETQHVREEEFIEPLVNRQIDIKISNRPLNAYEIGLNEMMPIIIANNLEEAKENELAMENHVQSESQKLSRSVKALGTGIRFINYISGSPTSVKKYINEDGEMVAYQLESDNISFSRKIKSMPVTN